MDEPDELEVGVEDAGVRVVGVVAVLGLVAVDDLVAGVEVAGVEVWLDAVVC